MSGSGNSIAGYGEVVPNSNVPFKDAVNITGDTYAGNFSSNEIPRAPHGMPQPSSNVVAASGNWTGNLMGGKRIKNIGKLYKMKAGRRSRKVHRSRRATSFSKSRRNKSSRSRRVSRATRTKRTKGGRRATKHRRGRRVRSRGRRTRSYRMRGGTGYTQYQSNVPYTPGYAVADVNVSPSLSAIANPPPYTTYNHCQDNYHHYDATQK